MSGVRGVGRNLSCTPPDPGGIQVLERRQIAVNHLLCVPDDALQSALVLGGGSSVPDGDGGEDGLDDGSVEVHHHCLWQVELLQLPQEEHPLLGFLCDGADVQLPFKVLGDDGSQEAAGLHNVDCGATQGDGGEWGWVLPEVCNHLHCHSIELQFVLGTPGRHVVNLPPVGGLVPTSDESNDGGVVRELQKLDRLVTGDAAVTAEYREKSRGERTQPWGEPVLMVRDSVCLPSLMCCFLSDRKYVHIRNLRL